MRNLLQAIAHVTSDLTEDYSCSHGGVQSVNAEKANKILSARGHSDAFRCEHGSLRPAMTKETTTDERDSLYSTEIPGLESASPVTQQP